MWVHRLRKHSRKVVEERRPRHNFSVEALAPDTSWDRTRRPRTLLRHKLAFRPFCSVPLGRHSQGCRAGRIHKVASVQDRVIEIVSSQLGVSKENITAETSFISDLGADSLDTVELVMELEEEFEINIPDDAAEKIQTVGQAVEFIEKHQS